MRVFYGLPNAYTDVTYLAYCFFWKEGVLSFPAGDLARAQVLGDPLPNIKKHLKISVSSVEFTIEAEYPFSLTCPPYEGKSRSELWKEEGSKLATPEMRLAWLHQHSRLSSGSLSEEYPEQLMTMKFLSPDATVLELGGNVGRNTIVIGTILSDSRRLVTLECSSISASLLEQTRRLNDLQFHIEASALSRVKLAQQGWTTFPYDGVLPVGWTEVPIISYPELKEKYQLNFDTLVVDCEGALYYILKDEPTLLEGIQTIIIENDFTVLEHKQYVDERFKEAGLVEVYRERLAEWNLPETRDLFYQVWRKTS